MKKLLLLLLPIILLSSCVSNKYNSNGCPKSKVGKSEYKGRGCVGGCNY